MTFLVLTIMSLFPACFCELLCHVIKLNVFIIFRYWIIAGTQALLMLYKTYTPIFL